MSLEKGNEALLGRLILCVKVIVYAAVAISLVFYVGEICSNGVTDFCLSTECVNTFVNRFSPSIEVLAEAIKLIVAISTVGGIIIAVKNYLSASYSASISNHISNFRVFKDFIDFEVSKLDRVNQNSINTITWYNEIFPDSRLGNLSVGNGYNSIIEEIDSIIGKSNEIITSSQKPDFSYKKHQFKMNDVLKKIGLNLAVLDRNDYYQTEEQVLRLLHTVNVEFCGIDKSIRERKYI